MTKSRTPEEKARFDKQIAKLQAEEKLEEHQQLMIELNDKENKYFDLVWYARSKPENFGIEGVKENIKRIQKQYPDDIEGLQSEEYGDWYHGFHSGCLAAFRYVTLLIEEGKELAEQEFPDLDS